MTQSTKTRCGSPQGLRVRIKIQQCDPKPRCTGARRAEARAQATAPPEAMVKVKDTTDESMAERDACLERGAALETRRGRPG